MPVGDYFQKYGPIHRRRTGHQDNLDIDQPLPRAGNDPHVPRLDEGEDGGEQPSLARLRRDKRRRLARTRRMAAFRHMAGMHLSPRQLLIGLLLVAFVLILSLPYGLSLYYQGRAMPGVRIQGTAVADLTSDAIRAALLAQYADFFQRPLTLQFATQSWQPAPADLGVTLDIERTIQAIMEQGRQGDPIRRLHDLWRLGREGIDVGPYLTVDQRQMQTYLLKLAAEMDTPPHDATVHITSEGQVLAGESIPGVQMLVDDSASDIMQALATLVPQQVPLRSRTLAPLVGNDAMQGAQKRAESLLRSPLVLRHGDTSWTWDSSRLAGLLRIETLGSQLVIQVDHEQVQKEIEGLAQEIDSGSVEPRVHFEHGALQIVQEGHEGWRLKQEDAFRIISDMLQKSQAITRTVKLPVEKLHPRITPQHLASLGIQELLSEGRSSFAGSAEYRITNIKAGATRMDGVLIAPDEEFSFNRQLGDVTPENGFVEGYAVIGNRTQLEWGGGVCQDSTTVFRAAFWAGLPITERYAHPFYISWYDQFAYGAYGDGPGMDATIYTGQNDLKFVNDTGQWLLLEAQVDEINQILTVQLYGSNSRDRRVEFDGPYFDNEVSAPDTPVYIDDPTQPAGTLYQSDVARNGRDITIYRIVLEHGVEVRRDPFFTRFRAWPNVYVRGTGG